MGGGRVVVGYGGQVVELSGEELRSKFLRIGSSLPDLGLVRRCSVGFTYGCLGTLLCPRPRPTGTGQVGTLHKKCELRE